MKALIIFFCTLLLCLTAKAGTRFICMSEVLVPGESVEVFLVQEEGRNYNFNDLPEVKNGTIQLQGQTYLRRSGSPTGRVLVYQFTCIADKAGTMEILPFAVNLDNGQKETAKLQPIPVLPFSSIQWMPLDSVDKADKYGVIYKVASTMPYVNEPTRCEIKLYLPQSLRDISLPSLNSDGVALSRFVPAFLEELRTMSSSGKALLEGKMWTVYSFSGHIAPLKPGLVTIGPGNVDSTTRIESIDPRRGQILVQQVLIPLVLPAHSISAESLPPGAPAGYQNAVGKFEIATETSATEITEGEPVSVTIKITGKGNLNIISCPPPAHEEKWKLYPPNKITPPVSDYKTAPPEEIEFQLLMKPLEKVAEIPSFKLVYFDPLTKTYGIAESKPIPLKWKSSGSASAASSSMGTPPPAGIVPVEQMSDILYTADSPWTPTLALSALLCSTLLWPWMLLPALLIVAWGFYSRYKSAKQLNLNVKIRLKKLQKIDSADPATAFLRNLGFFIESEIPEKERTEEVQNILQERDSHSYIPGAEEIDLPQTRRTHMLKAVRMAMDKLPVLLFLCVLIFPLAAAGASENPAAGAFLDGDYTTAGKLIAEQDTARLPVRERANHYYLAGNIEYKLNNPGKAALNYRKALYLVPDYPEAERNLAFIERKEGSVSELPTSRQEILSKVPYVYYKAVFLLALLVCSVMAACMWARRRTGVTAWIIFAVTLLVSVGGIWSLYQYPARQNPLRSKDQFIITQSNASAWHAATKDSTKVFAKLPPASASKVLYSTENWLYAEFYGGVRAWIPRGSGDFVIPVD